MLQKPLAEAFSAGGCGYDDVFQFPLGGDVLGDKESYERGWPLREAEGVRFDHENQPFRAFGLEGLAVLIFRPVAARWRIGARDGSWKVRRRGWRGGFALGFWSNVSDLGSFLHENLSVGATHVVRFQLLRSCGLAGLQFLPSEFGDHLGVGRLD